MKRVVQQRLSWMLKTVGVYPDEMTGFRQHRSTADSISDLVTSLDDVRATRHPAYMVLLDIHCAFDALPHNSIFAAFSTPVIVVGC